MRCFAMYAVNCERAIGMTMSFCVRLCIELHRAGWMAGCVDCGHLRLLLQNRIEQQILHDLRRVALTLNRQTDNE